MVSVLLSIVFDLNGVVCFEFFSFRPLYQMDFYFSILFLCLYYTVLKCPHCFYLSSFIANLLYKTVTYYVSSRMRAFGWVKRSLIRFSLFCDKTSDENSIRSSIDTLMFWYSTKSKQTNKQNAKHIAMNDQNIRTRSRNYKYVYAVHPAKIVKLHQSIAVLHQ